MPFQIFLAAYLLSDTIRKNSHSDELLIWSIATVLSDLRTSSVYVILICRLVLGIYRRLIGAAVRFASDWFSDKERTQAAGIISIMDGSGVGTGFRFYYALDAAFGWRNVFIIWCDRRFVVVPHIAMLKKREENAYYRAPANRKTKLTTESLGGTPFSLFLPAITQGMLFWGDTLWIPMVCRILSAIPDSE